MVNWEVITAKGQGLWGSKRYDLRLLTSTKTYSDSLRQATRSVTRFVLAFDLNPEFDRRWFNSERARHEFMDKSFSELALISVPESEQESYRVNSSLQAAVGECLSSVTFVMDYLQVDFSGCRFNMYTWPFITVHNKTFTYEDVGYKDAICFLIGETLTEIEEYLDRGLTLQFKNGALISLSLKVPKDFPCPEVAEFHTPRSGSWIIWQAGEEPLN